MSKRGELFGRLAYALGELMFLSLTLSLATSKGMGGAMNAGANMTARWHSGCDIKLVNTTWHNYMYIREKFSFFRSVGLNLKRCHFWLLVEGGRRKDPWLAKGRACHPEPSSRRDPRTCSNDSDNASLCSPLYCRATVRFRRCMHHKQPCALQEEFVVEL